MNRHLKTDIMGKPHRSLDTYDHPSSSLGGVGVGGGNPASTGRSTFQRARSLGSSDYHQHTQGRGSSHGYQTEGRGTSSGYQTEGHGLSNGYQDERRVSPYGAKGEGRGSSSMYQGSQDYQSPAGYQSDGQQQPVSAVEIYLDCMSEIIGFTESMASTISNFITHYPSNLWLHTC